MGPDDIKKKILLSFEELNSILKLTHLEILLFENEKLNSFYSKTFDLKTSLPFLKIKENTDKITYRNKDIIKLRIKPETGREIHCVLCPLIISDKNAGYLLYESAESYSPENEKLLKFFSLVLTTLEEAEINCRQSEAKEKENITNMRSMQAQLFPKFDNAPGFDIASVYLPVDLMSGNFVAAMYINNNIYQIVAYNIGGYDSTASYAGAAIRTLIRAFSSKKTAPSALLENVITRLTRMIPDVVHSLMFITIYQIDIKTGKTRISGYGDISTIFFSAGKKAVLSLNKTEMGRILAKRNTYKDFMLTVEPSDALLYYSSGAVNATTADGKMQFGEGRIIDIFKREIGSSSKEIMYSISREIFEHINYSRLEEDILLVCVKRR